VEDRHVVKTAELLKADRSLTGEYLGRTVPAAA
jgi:hypothetical protein